MQICVLQSLLCIVFHMNIKFYNVFLHYTCSPVVYPDINSWRIQWFVMSVYCNTQEGITIDNKMNPLCGE